MAWLSSKWLKVLLGVLGVGCVLAIIFPCPCRSRESARRASCQSNLKQISLAIQQYSEDFDGRLPLTRVGDVPSAGYRPAYGWADAIAPYSFAPSDFVRVLQCPSEADRSPISGTASGQVLLSSRNFTDYWFNARLSHIARQRLAEPASILLAGEGNDGRENCNARYALSTLPEACAHGGGFPGAPAHGRGQLCFR